MVAELLDGFDVTYDNLCVLLADAPDGCVEHLARRLRAGWQFQAAWALAAIGTEAALAAVADLVRTGADAREFEDCGIWVPPKVRRSAGSRSTGALSNCASCSAEPPLPPPTTRWACGWPTSSAIRARLRWPGTTCHSNCPTCPGCRVGRLIVRTSPAHRARWAGW
ncbi:hypothetical protein ACFQX7_37095 [Luedemannella flava]